MTEQHSRLRDARDFVVLLSIVAILGLVVYKHYNPVRRTHHRVRGSFEAQTGVFYFDGKDGRYYSYNFSVKSFDYAKYLTALPTGGTWHVSGEESPAYKTALTVPGSLTQKVVDYVVGKAYGDEPPELRPQGVTKDDYHCWWWKSVCTKGSDAPDGRLQLMVAFAQLKIQMDQSHMEEGIQALANVQLPSKAPEPTQSIQPSAGGSEKTGADIATEVAKTHRVIQRIKLSTLYEEDNQFVGHTANRKDPYVILPLADMKCNVRDPASANKIRDPADAKRIYPHAGKKPALPMDFDEELNRTQDVFLTQYDGFGWLMTQGNEVCLVNVEIWQTIFEFK
jgi:hypothetical protein